MFLIRVSVGELQLGFKLILRIIQVIICICHNGCFVISDYNLEHIENNFCVVILLRRDKRLRGLTFIVVYNQL